MAVIVSNGATNLSTVNGFYRAESYNLSAWSNTILALSTTRQIGVTFANAGNCKGLIIPLCAIAHVTRDVTVLLQENVASVWTTRASVTLTAAQISNSTANTTQANWYTPFEFSVPYAVDTTASKWRFDISQGAGSQNWYLSTSNGTAPTYIAWCDNAVSYTTGDVPVAKEKITIDQNCTFTGLLSTGDATNSTCAIACRSTTPTVGNDAMFEWENPPAASYTMNIDGWFVLSAHSGFRAGTSANRIPIAQMGKVEVKSATSGTAINTGFTCGKTTSGANVVGRMSVNIYGEIPTYQRTTLASNAAISQQDIVTTDSTGWAIGDQICITKGNLESTVAETAPFTIDTIAGTAINVNTNILTAIRKAGGHVFRLNGYGFYFTSNFSGTAPTQYLGGHNGFTLSGVQIQSVGFFMSGGTSQYYDEPANIATVCSIDNCSYYSVAAVGSLLGSVNASALSRYEFDKVNVFRNSLAGIFYGPSVRGSITIKNSVFFNSTGSPVTGFFRNKGVMIEDNYFYNISQQAIGVATGMAASTIQNNIFWGCRYVIRVDGAAIDIDWRNNTVDFASIVFWNFSAMTNFRVVGDSYGLNGLVNYIMSPFVNYNSYTTMTLKDLNIGTVTSKILNISDAVDGSTIGFQNYDLLDKDDSTYMTYGEIQRTHSTLPDTTVRTAGGSAMRFTPTSSTDSMYWEQIIPTGNIQNKTMTITCWVYINNAAYYAGTHTKPTLTVTYDQTSTATSVATATAGSWQQLAVTFTPTTTFGQVTMKITGATDATTTSRYFYVDDFNIAYPAGVQIDLGGLDLWANGLPVEPAIATMPSITGVWDEPLSVHTVSGSAGKILKDAADNAEAAAYDMYK
jgi:hypothetical protein